MNKALPLAVALLTVCGLALPFTAAPQARAADTLEQPDAPASEKLPIRRITLYRSGVASFLRRGTVDGNSSIQLRFQTDQINDILKSMVALDFGGGQVGAISYGSKDPLERRLASFGVDISDNPSLPDLIERLRGSMGTVTTTEGPITGIILGVETRKESKGQSQELMSVPYVNLLTTAGIKPINLTTIGSFQLQDAKLAEELNKALLALAEHRADRTKTVDIAFNGQAAREVAVAYVHETPVWKVSYRLVLPETPKVATGGTDPAPRASDSRKPAAPDAKTLGGQNTIQGWALVENTTDEDWQNVALSLVSGRPVSFVMDLYEPLYLERPEVPVPTVPGVAPRIYAEGGQSPFSQTGAYGGVERERLESRSGAPPAAAPQAPGGVFAKRYRDQDDEAKNAPAFDAAAMQNYAAQAQAQAQAAESGEVFQYELSAPVTIQRQRSAMLPIISSPVGGRRVSIYNRADGAEHPMRGVELINSTDLQLLPGPVSVFDDGTYAGDAQIGHVSPGDKRLLAYAVDLDVVARVKDESRRTTNKIRIVGGWLEEISTQRNQLIYDFVNKDQKRDRDVVLEHSKSGETLVEPAKPADEAGNLYRFEVKVGAGKKESLKVVEESVVRHRYELFNYDFNAVLGFAKDGKASEKVVEALREAGRRRGLVQDQERKLAELEKERAGISQDQDRIRQNMGSIDRQSQLYTRYMQKLTDQETRIEKLHDEQEATTAALNAARQDLEAYIRSLNIE
jgi:hypothetical protein